MSLRYPWNNTPLRAPGRNRALERPHRRSQDRRSSSWPARRRFRMHYTDDVLKRYRLDGLPILASELVRLGYPVDAVPIFLEAIALAEEPDTSGLNSRLCRIRAIPAPDSRRLEPRLRRHGPRRAGSIRRPPARRGRHASERSIFTSPKRQRGIFPARMPARDLPRGMPARDLPRGMPARDLPRGMPARDLRRTPIRTATRPSTW